MNDLQDLPRPSHLTDDRIVEYEITSGYPIVIAHNGMGYLCYYVMLGKDHPYRYLTTDNIHSVAGWEITYSELDDEGFRWIGGDFAHHNHAPNAAWCSAEYKYVIEAYINNPFFGNGKQIHVTIDIVLNAARKVVEALRYVMPELTTTKETIHKDQDSETGSLTYPEGNTAELDKVKVSKIPATADDFHDFPKMEVSGTVIGSYAYIEPPEPPKTRRGASPLIEDMATTSSKQLVNALKESGQDHEFYPTTDEIIRAVVRDLHNSTNSSASTILDIGAGNGKVLRALQKSDFGRGAMLMAIEKSTRLHAELDKDIIIIGTDFKQQFLADKRVDLMFCNPPYSEYEEWVVKIIREGCAADAYLVIPERWESSRTIAAAIKFRGESYKPRIVGSFDFTNSEDRKARAKVHLLHISFAHGNRYTRSSSDEPTDAFESFFNDQFGDVAERFSGKQHEESSKEREAKRVKTEALVCGASYVEAMVNLYEKEIAHIQRSYSKLGECDIDLLRELGVSLKSVRTALWVRLRELRAHYWRELFNQLDTVTNRLTAKSRGRLLETLNKHTQVDFTKENICAVMVWVIKNANDYLEEQLIETFETLVDSANVKMYKSNQRAFSDDDWRYMRRRNEYDPSDQMPERFALDFRIVAHYVGGINKTVWSYNKGLQERAANYLMDLLTVAYNLGFTGETAPTKLHRNGLDKWESGKVVTFYCKEPDGRASGLMQVRAFYNGNLHIKLNQRFALALNIEYGRLRGWLKSPAEAQDQLNLWDLDVKKMLDKQALNYFKSNKAYTLEAPTNLLT